MDDTGENNDEDQTDQQSEAAGEADIEMKDNKEHNDEDEANDERKIHEGDSMKDDEEANEAEEDSPYLRVSDPAVLSCHHDGYLRFWTLEVSVKVEVLSQCVANVGRLGSSVLIG